MQADGERALDDVLAKKGGKFGVSQGALVAMAPDGAIRALIGGRDYAASQFDRAVAAKRQPGSAFKPFVYLAGIEKGLTPETVRADAPIDVHGWHPENYSHSYLGPVTLTKALSMSLNTVAVRVCLEAGPKNVVAVAHRLGINSDLGTNASIALGTSEVSPLELVSAYVPFANGGIGVQPHAILRIRTTAGHTLYQRRPGSNGRVIAPHDVALMNTMMTETLLSGTARKGQLDGWQAGGKTGTSQDYRDAWFVGYTGRLVAGVWLGNDDSSPTRKASGGTLPTEIWSRFMKSALAGETPSPLPFGTAHAAPAPPPAAPESGLPSSLFGIPLPGLGHDEPVAQAAPRPIGRVHDAYDEMSPPRPTRPVARDQADAAPDEDAPSRRAEAGHERSLAEKLFGSPL